ncbi:unnamed protein product [Callosobruchus maculatus]|uniref:Lipocalin/cytosolic fatty-acid binding domain-containing protein n=1 Tax=Callosobruchus maculatus TaxID=64391 RepID=A0A653C1H9_CALMS|nr:unnamed protein product [Callosobruchus maculatus]
MLPVFFLILPIALGASASSCPSSLKGVEVDRKSIEGRWWVQVQYGIPPVTNHRCYNVQLSLNSDNKLDNLQSWKVGSKTIRESTPEIAPPSDSSYGDVYFQLTDGVEAAWFVQVDYNEYYAMYGCKNGEERKLTLIIK